MLNKKLVIAALLAAAAAADGDEVAKDEAAAKEEPAKEEAGAAKEGEEAADGEKAADGEEKAGEEKAGEEKADEKEGDEKDAKDGKDGDKADDDKMDWPVVAEDGTVLCDQGETAFWEQAHDKLEDLKAKKAAAQAAVDKAFTPWDAQRKEAETQAAAAGKHKEENAGFLDDAQAAEDKVKELTDAAAKKSGDVTTQRDAAQAVADVEKDTADGVTRVEEARARLATLIQAQTTQAAEEAALEERLEVATVALDAAKDNRTAANVALRVVKQQVEAQTKVEAAAGIDGDATEYAALPQRSKLYRVLGYIDAAEWNNTHCGVDANTCGWYESSGTKATSEWEWKADCDKKAQNGSVTNKCTVMGLTALIAQVDTVLGPSTRAADQAAGLHKDFADADYMYDKDGGTTKMATALANYLAWQKLDLMSQAYEVSCWKSTPAAGAGGDYVANTDQWSACARGAAVEAGVAFYPIMMLTQDAKITLAGTAKQTFELSYPDVDKTKWEAKAQAQIDVWSMEWVKLALQARLDAVGNVAKNGEAGWAATETGLAEASVATKKLLVAAAEAEVAARTAWEAGAAAEAAAAGEDVKRAQVLLKDLVEEIVPLARAEVAARAALAAADEALAASTEATAELGVDYSDADAENIREATGAQAVLRAALVAKASIDKQQEFHDARAQWAADNLAPLAKVYNDRVKENDSLADDVADATERLAGAKAACKRMAFAKAQERLEEKAAFEKAREQQVKDVLEAYTARAKIPTDGSAGTLCHYPRKAADAAQEPRAPCLEGDPGKPLCCGAAQRFLKDGTKLSIETCQLATATTYTYYPALPAGALAEETPQTWRFQCISAAQKLAAAATAALAAGYMMA